MYSYNVDIAYEFVDGDVLKRIHKDFIDRIFQCQGVTFARCLKNCTLSAVVEGDKQAFVVADMMKKVLKDNGVRYIGEK